MHPSTTIGDRLKILRGDLKQEDFAKAIAINRDSLRAYETGRSLPNAKVLAEICTQFSTNPQWLLLGEGPMRRGGQQAVPGASSAPEIMLIPKVKARLSAGSGSLETSNDVVGFYGFRTSFLKRRGHPSSMVLMTVVGDSMDPEIKGGDTVLIDQSQNETIAGGIYAVGMDEEVVVKIVDKSPGKLILRSYNNVYSPLELDMRGDLADNVRIIGRVLWWCREPR